VGVLLVVVVLAVAATAAVVIWMGRAGTRHALPGDAAPAARPGVRPDRDVLRYAVPEGQDPAPLVAALTGSGYPADLEDDVHRRTVVVTCPQGVVHDRGDVRALLERVTTTLQDGAPVGAEVRFEDEPGRR
jgi:hypothetical protein